MTKHEFDMLLLIGHGSPDPAGNTEYLEFARLLAERLEMSVQPCFLELAEPSIEDGVAYCIAAGATHIAVLPLLLGAAGHQKNDIPALLNHAREHWPDIALCYGTPIGVQYPVIAVLAERAAAVLATTQSTIPHAETALIVVARGSSDPDSNADVFKVSRLLWEGRDYGRVETAFQSVTAPDVGTAIENCIRLGARRIVVLPYLLFTGFVCNDIKQQVTAARQRFSHIEVVVAHHLGNHQGVIDAVVQRFDDIRSGNAAMTCDLCKYRYRMAGFEDDYGRPQEAHHHDHDHDHHHHH